VNLWRYDPLIADAGAVSVFRLEIPVQHRLGELTTRRVTVQGGARGRERFYVSVEGCDLDIDGYNGVWWDGLAADLPHVVVMRPRTSPAACSS
jgi:hypothetical protein